MGLFDDPVGFFNGGPQGPFGQTLGNYLSNVGTGQYALQGLQGINNAFKTGDLEGLAGYFGGLALPIKAYHGSPYDFSAFDASKIGTGEGAQAYGHGLYFAEQPQTAESYRFANSSPWAGAGNHAIATKAQAAADAQGLTGDAARKAALGWLQDQASALPQSARQPIYDAMNNYDALTANKPGRMYEVNINAEPDQFLHWDKPLSGQSETVRNALQGLGFQTDLPKGYSVTKTGSGDHMVIDPMGIGATGKGGMVARGQTPEDALSLYLPTGGQLYESSRIVPGAYRDPAAASATLNQAGIPGIRYLDQGSRGAGQGTSNYVVFNPSIIDILRKYGLAGLTAGGGLPSFMSGQQENTK